MGKRTAARILGSIIAVTIMSGCGSNLDDPDHPVTKEEIAHAEAEMRKLPSVEDTERQLSTVIQQIADATKNVAPELDWRIKPNRGQGTLGCPRAYMETDGVSMTTDDLISPVPIPDSRWADVLKVARDIAAQNGITTLTVRVDVAGRHDVILHSPDNGNEIGIGTYKAALITGTTGCRFRAEDLQKQPGN
ncbi:LppA family lipoprotein [Nocardia transvalensis]|uniref:LppA family lipoprotein n=1 Tax=Nocardia transvalensis TaxID=37333 RepID=UPI0018945AC3|nr:LppA family lipoprotein [Nocardia transvalensis]MBF6327508.1 LppA family lipoprotein [Nocardia transvalensis]